MEKTSLHYRGRFPQTLPVPTEIGPAGPEPWEAKRDLVASIGFGRLSTVLPALLAPVDIGSPDPATPSSTRQAAVLIPIFRAPTGVGLLFTKRSSALSRHAGEISFPGGGVEAEESYVDAALRETEEEIGLDRSRLSVIGSLGEMNTVRGESSFYTFVAMVDQIGLLKTSDEVDELLPVDLARLCDPEIYHRESWSGIGFPRRVMYFYELGGNLLWGATAKLVTDLLNLIAETL